MMRILILLAAFLLNFTLPALADDVANAQSVIRAQEDAFRHDDASAAYSYAAPSIRTRRSIATGASTSAKPVPPTTKSPSASTSSTTMAKPGRRCIRWSSSPTAA
jgi:hypothetical protein